MTATEPRYEIIRHSGRYYLWNNVKQKSIPLPMQGPFEMGCASNCGEIVAFVSEQRLPEGSAYWMHIYFWCRKNQRWTPMMIRGLPDCARNLEWVSTGPPEFCLTLVGQQALSVIWTAENQWEMLAF